MQTRQNSIFTTIRTEGAILPADLLVRITEGKNVPGLAPEDYHLSGEKLNEATNRSWNRLLGAWENFRKSWPGGSAQAAGTTDTREKWLLPLFQELGYGRLQTAKSIDIDKKNYPISHLWGRVPIHLVAANITLDRPTKGVSGAARSSPHSMIQELLNATDDYLWAFVSNGLKLRILRDNSRLTRQAYVEFDLQAMMEGEVYSDFVLLYLLCHESRVEDDKPAECWLERWSKLAQEQGTRALEGLRRGVEEAIEALGAGFISHPANGVLRDKLRSGELKDLDYYRQLLRLVYRLIFLAVAEERDLLLDPQATVETRKLYSDYYSLARLRHLAGVRRGTRHSDLFATLWLVMEQLGSDGGYPELGLPALDSFLFENGGRGSMPDLDNCELTNAALLDAVRALSYTSEGGVRRLVDYRNLGSEELGSVYEALLEMHPDLNIGAGTFELRTVTGSERKTTGSYYTPTSLINSLLDTALDPVLEEASRKPNPEEAILDLKVCDPACGSGHFLVGAAHRIAKRLASVRTGDEEPSPDATRRALRDVIGKCIYGVDINPMSVELCKVSLWMEAIEPGKPLSFLDAHIKVGNSLLGTTPRLLAAGIPDAAFEPIEGDDKKVCTEYRNRNKQERAGQTSFYHDLLPIERLGNLSTGMMGIDHVDDSSLEGIRRKQELYADLLTSGSYVHEKLWADSWCAAFVWRKQNSKEGDSYPMTESEFRTIEAKGLDGTSKWRIDEIRRLSRRYGFFHWHLEFPQVFRVVAPDEQPSNDQVGWVGGFDVVLGNPPWERINLKDVEWFAARRPDIASAPNAATRKEMIETLKTEDPGLHAAFQDDVRRSEGESHLLRRSGGHPLTGRGDINTYAVFAETMWTVLNSSGRVGCVLESGIATDDTTKYFFQEMLNRQALVSFRDFENRRKIFPAVQGNVKFCLFTLSASPQVDFLVSAQLDDPRLLADSERQYRLTPADIRLVNPNTLNCPTFRSARDAKLVREIQSRIAVFMREGTAKSNPWEAGFSTPFHMANDSKLFRHREFLEAEGWTLTGSIFTRGQEKYLPLYEAKLAFQFNHRAATFDGIPPSERFRLHAGTNTPSLSELSDPSFAILPRYWVPESEVNQRLDISVKWLLGFRNAISAVADSRSFVATIIPMTGVGHSMPVITASQNPLSLSMLLATMNSLVVDYVLRQKASGGNLSYYVLRQLPILSPVSYSRRSRWKPSQSVTDSLSPLVLELTYTAWDLQPFAHDCGYEGPPFTWDEERRFLLRCELDAAFFHLYGIGRDDVDYIMETFPIVKHRDEAAHGGRYRTKETVLDIYDAMQQVMDTGETYRTRLDPPPALGWEPQPKLEAEIWESGGDDVTVINSRSRAVRQLTASAALMTAVHTPVPDPRPATTTSTSPRPTASGPLVQSEVPGTTRQPAGDGMTAKTVAPGSPAAAPSAPPVPATSVFLEITGQEDNRPVQRSMFGVPERVALRPGDRVRHPAYGDGDVLDVIPNGADQWVTVRFRVKGTKKFMASLAKLEKL